MKANSFRLLLAFVLSLCCLSHLARAQSKTGTTIGQVLLIEPSARAAAMGNAGAAMDDEIVAAFYNPAAIGRQSGYGAQFSHSEWLAGIDYNYAAASIQLGEIGNLFLSVTALNSGEIEVRTPEQPLGTGARYTVSNLALGLGYGRQLSDRFSVGVQLNFLQEAIWHSSLSTFALNVGTIYRLAENGLRICASISNFGLQTGYSGRDLRIQYDLKPDEFGDNSSLPGEVHTDEFSLPVLFRVGLSWPVHFGKSNQVQFAVDAFHPNDNTESMSAGAEWTFVDVFSLRCGFQNFVPGENPKFPYIFNRKDDSITGLTVGAGLNYDFAGYAFRFDYSWADYGPLQNTQRFSLGLTF